MKKLKIIAILIICLFIPLFSACAVKNQKVDKPINKTTATSTITTSTKKTIVKRVIKKVVIKATSTPKISTSTYIISPDLPIIFSTSTAKPLTINEWLTKTSPIQKSENITNIVEPIITHIPIPGSQTQIKVSDSDNNLLFASKILTLGMILNKKIDVFLPRGSTKMITVSVENNNTSRYVFNFAGSITYPFQSWHNLGYTMLTKSITRTQDGINNSYSFSISNDDIGNPINISITLYNGDGKISSYYLSFDICSNSNPSYNYCQ